MCGGGVEGAYPRSSQRLFSRSKRARTTSLKAKILFQILESIPGAADENLSPSPFSRLVSHFIFTSTRGLQ